jgi:hypothetical protein
MKKGGLSATLKGLPQKRIWLFFVPVQAAAFFSFVAVDLGLPLFFDA